MTAFLASSSPEILDGGGQPWSHLHGRHGNRAGSARGASLIRARPHLGAPGTGELGQGLLGRTRDRRRGVPQPLALWLQSELLGAHLSLAPSLLGPLPPSERHWPSGAQIGGCSVLVGTRPSRI